MNGENPPCLGGGINPEDEVFTLSHQGQPMIDRDPDTQSLYFYTLTDAIIEREEVRSAWAAADRNFIEDDWQIVAVVPIAITANVAQAKLLHPSEII